MVKTLKGRSLWLVCLVSALVMLSPSILIAEDNCFYLGVTGQVTPFLSGNAGTGMDAPSYKDAFGTGWGVGLEGGYRLTESFSAQLGIGYERFSGSTPQGISFDSLSVVPIYAGGKYHVLANKCTWDPYIRLDLGAAYLSSVDTSFMGSSGRYWDSSWVFLFDAGAGIEYHMSPFGVFAEVKARYMGSPSSSMSPMSDADSSWTLPINLGLRYYF
ncbi:MAG: outer membrane beta-barrel protein [Deltaproteobacteria bacterium]|nr:outer membrane beta-barrel protein [Deltaproteobacteria bacterium]